MLIQDFFRVFRLGYELTNAELWKRRQVLVNTLAAFIGAAVAVAAAFGYPINLDSDGVNAIAGAIAALVGLFNAGATVATTTRIGLPNRGDDVLTARPDGSGHANDSGTDRAGIEPPGPGPGTDDSIPVLTDKYRG